MASCTIWEMSLQNFPSLLAVTWVYMRAQSAKSDVSSGNCGMKQLYKAALCQIKLQETYSGVIQHCMCSWVVWGKVKRGLDTSFQDPPPPPPLCLGIYECIPFGFRHTTIARSYCLQWCREILRIPGPYYSLRIVGTSKGRQQACFYIDLIDEVWTGRTSLELVLPQSWPVFFIKINLAWEVKYEKLPKYLRR